jgi:hypothetical protein
MTPQVPGGNGYSECVFKQQHGYLLLWVAVETRRKTTVTFFMMPQVSWENKEKFCSAKFQKLFRR